MLSAMWAPVVLVDAGVVLVPALVGVSTLWLGFWFLAGMCGGCVGYLVLRLPPAEQRPRVWAAARVGARSEMFAAAMLGRGGHWMLIIAVALIGPTVAAAVWGMAPLGWAVVLCLTAKDGSGSRYQQLTVPVVVAAVLVCGGCVAVVLSQPLQIRSSGWMLVAGLAAAAFGTGLDCLNSLSVSWGLRTAASAGARRDPRREAWLCVLCAAAAAAAACGVALVAAVAGPEPAPAAGSALVCVLFGAVCGAVPVVWVREILTRTSVASVMVLSTATPAVSVAYLASLGLLGGVNGWVLVGGVGAVIAGSVAALRSSS